MAKTVQSRQIYLKELRTVYKVTDGKQDYCAFASLFFNNKNMGTIIEKQTLKKHTFLKKKRYKDSKSYYNFFLTLL